MLANLTCFKLFDNPWKFQVTVCIGTLEPKSFFGMTLRQALSKSNTYIIETVKEHYI